MPPLDAAHENKYHNRRKAYIPAFAFALSISLCGDTWAISDNFAKSAMWMQCMYMAIIASEALLIYSVVLICGAQNPASSRMYWYFAYTAINIILCGELLGNLVDWALLFIFDPFILFAMFVLMGQ